MRFLLFLEHFSISLRLVVSAVRDVIILIDGKGVLVSHVKHATLLVYILIYSLVLF